MAHKEKNVFRLYFSCALTSDINVWRVIFFSGEWLFVKNWHIWECWHLAYLLQSRPRREKSILTTRKKSYEQKNRNLMWPEMVGVGGMGDQMVEAKRPNPHPLFDRGRQDILYPDHLEQKRRQILQFDNMVRGHFNTSLQTCLVFWHQIGVHCKILTMAAET